MVLHKNLFDRPETFSSEFLAKFDIWVIETSKSDNEQKSYEILQVAFVAINFLQFFFSRVFDSYPQ